MLKKIAYGVAGFGVIALAVLAGHYLYGLATGTRFTTSEWTAAAAWFGGSATFCAVLVALWQSRAARQEAADARNEARALLSRQLDQELRNARLKAIQDYVDSVEHMGMAIRKLKGYVLTLVSLALPFHGGGLLDDVAQGVRRSNVTAWVARTYVRDTPLAEPFEHYRDAVNAYIAFTFPPNRTAIDLIRQRWSYRRGGPGQVREEELRREVRKRSATLLDATYLHSRQGTIHDLAQDE